ncbi:ribosomal L22e protein family-domain-containing protein [Rhodotorula diobovata]|uniref:Ribosomal L22e protein family-domain-containing protein n=1 Tax=Rhodotorula diobovata TaxID=5288 RepID=A0A5C5FM06_9BASI|nr:ribosomal L22e protein family-domain-containing protein [Rhodotorula diobovata]
MAPSVVSVNVSVGAPVLAKKQTKVKTAPHKFVIDYSGPANDKIFDAAAYEKFLVDHIKVEGKTGQLGEDVKLQREAAGKLSVTSTVPFSKRYLKYLTKKFLKKHQMREWLRVVSTGKDTYTLKFYNLSFDGEGEAQE